jgi:hypothetical protein
MTALAALATVAPPKCPRWCTSSHHHETEPWNDAGAALHLSEPVWVDDTDDPDGTRVVTYVHRADGPAGRGEVSIFIAAPEGSLSLDSARKLIAALTEQVAIVEAAR